MDAVPTRPGWWRGGWRSRTCWGAARTRAASPGCSARRSPWPGWSTPERGYLHHTIHQVYLHYLHIYITVRHERFSHALYLQNISIALSPLVMSVSALFAWEINKLEVDMIASSNPMTPMCSLDWSSTLLIFDLMSDVWMVWWMLNVYCWCLGLWRAPVSVLMTPIMIIVTSFNKNCRLGSRLSLPSIPETRRS